MLCILVCFCFASSLWAQEDTVLARQCSALRELVYIGQQNRFSSIIDLRISGSHGYQPNGLWTFSNEHFTTTLPWQASSRTSIEHSTDHRDTLFTESWQYMAEFTPTKDSLYANRFLLRMVAQINQCVLPLSDSISIHLQPVDPTNLPPSKPDNLAEAFLFYLPPPANPTLQTSIMMALEKTRSGYRPILIIEVLEETRK
jgi:hypothetical protein